MRWETKTNIKKLFHTVSQLKQPECESGKKPALTFLTKNQVNASFFNEKEVGIKLICTTAS